MYSSVNLKQQNQKNKQPKWKKKNQHVQSSEINMQCDIETAHSQSVSDLMHANDPDYSWAMSVINEKG